MSDKLLEYYEITDRIKLDADYIPTKKDIELLEKNIDEESLMLYLVWAEDTVCSEIINLNKEDYIYLKDYIKDKI